MEQEKRLEGHFKWFHELAQKPANETLQSYCATKLTRSGILPNRTGADFEWKEWSETMAKKFNSTALAILSGETEISLLLLEQLDKLLEEKCLRETTDNQRNLFLYCRDVLRWKLLDGDMNGVEAKRLEWKWAVLKCDGRNEMKAAVCFLKGRLGMELGNDMEKVQKFYLEAIQLDPNCLAWYNHAYLLAREIRLKTKRQGRGRPSVIELELAEKAYKLCEGENLIAAANWGIMSKEIWMRKNETFWRENLATYRKIVKNLENGLQFAEGGSPVKIKTHLAEFLYFGKGQSREDKLRGRTMFLELEQKYLYSLPVLYLVGKLYFEEGDLGRARKCYERALRTDPTGGPCLSDYLKLLKLNRKVGDMDEIVRVLEKGLSNSFITKDTKKFFKKQLDFAEKKIHSLKKLETLMIMADD